MREISWLLCRNPYIRDPSGKVLAFSKILGTDALGATPFPCGQCLPCRINKRRVWTLRLMLEAYFYEKMSFVTLTYSDDNLRYNADGLSVLDKRDCQLWLKRLRKHFDRTGIRYYLAGEYGSRTHRPHYHVILFGVSPDELDPQWVSFDGKSGGVQGISRRTTPLSTTWKLGLVHVGTVTRDSIQYVAGYVTKKFTKKGDSLVPEFTLQSRNPGIGAQALLELSAVFNRDQIAEKADGNFALTVKLGRSVDIFKAVLNSSVEVESVLMTITKNLEKHGFRQTDLELNLLNTSSTWMMVDTNSSNQKIEFTIGETSYEEKK